MFVPWFLCTSICYYRWELSVLSDSLFDTMCRDALKGWRAIGHRHKRFIKRDMLTQGTGYNLPWGKLPGIVWGGAQSMHKELTGAYLEA